MTTEGDYGIVARYMTEQLNVPVERIKPDARLAEDLGLTWEDADCMFAGIANWPQCDMGLGDGGTYFDYWSVYRGLDRHYLSPYRERDARRRVESIVESARLSLLGPTRLQPAPVSFEPLTLSAVLRIVDAKRYVCGRPLAGLEETLRRVVSQFAKRLKGAVISGDCRLREDLGLDWSSLRQVLVVMDCLLEGAFYAGGAGALMHDSLLNWQIQENVAGTPPLRLAHLVATVGENRWVGPTGVDWRFDIPGIQEGRPLSDAEMLRTLRWLLVERGNEFENVSLRTRLGSYLEMESVLLRLEKLLDGRFVFSQEIKDELRSSYPAFTFRVADVVRIAQANRWVEPKKQWFSFFS